MWCVSLFMKISPLKMKCDHITIWLMFQKARVEINWTIRTASFDFCGEKCDGIWSCLILAVVFKGTGGVSRLFRQLDLFHGTSKSFKMFHDTFCDFEKSSEVQETLDGLKSFQVVFKSSQTFQEAIWCFSWSKKFQ